MSRRDGHVLKGAYCWYGLCRRCGQLQSAGGQPEVFKLVEAHIKKCNAISSGHGAR